jgi:hypothetical protein
MVSPKGDEPGGKSLQLLEVTPPAGLEAVSRDGGAPSGALDGVVNGLRAQLLRELKKARVIVGRLCNAGSSIGAFPVAGMHPTEGRRSQEQ